MPDCIPPYTQGWPHFPLLSPVGAGQAGPDSLEMLDDNSQRERVPHLRSLSGRVGVRARGVRQPAVPVSAGSSRAAALPFPLGDFSVLEQAEAQGCGKAVASLGLRPQHALMPVCENLLSHRLFTQVWGAPPSSLAHHLGQRGHALSKTPGRAGHRG